MQILKKLHRIDGTCFHSIVLSPVQLFLIYDYGMTGF